MSTTIDNRIVEMQFDNSDFEKNVKASLSTLKNLNSSLDNLSSANSLKGLDKAGNIDLSALEKSIDTVNSRFSTMGIIGMAALQTITEMAVKAGAKLASALISPIKTGGFNRALNLENAKFQLEGLLKSAEAVDEVMKDVDYGVKDTAYSLDAAAKVAAQLTASGIKAGEGMQKSLRGISGVASMTNSTYEEIGSIFTTVAGQGKVMTMQLRQLESRGLNAAAVLGQQLGKSEAQIREMVSNGEVSFKMFASAMDDAFGEHAKDANKTFTGALSNMKAALARTGAMFAGPYLTNMRDVFNAIRLSVNALNGELGPIADTAEAVMVKLKTLFVNSLLDPISGKVRTEIINIIQSLVKVFDNLNKVAGTVLDAIGTAFNNIFSGITANHVELFALTIEKLSSNLLNFTNKAAPHITMGFRGIFKVFSLLGEAISGIIKVLKPFGNLASESILFILKIIGAIGEYTYILAQSLKTNETFISIVEKIKSVVGPTFEFITKSIDKVINAMQNFSGLSDLNLPGINGLEKFKALDALEMFLTVIQKFFNIIRNIATSIAPIVSSVFEHLGNIFGNIAEGFSKLLTSLKFNNISFDVGGIAIIGTVLWAFAGTLKNIYLSITWTIGRLKMVFSKFLPNVVAPILNPLVTLNEIPGAIKGVFVSTSQAIREFTSQIKTESLIKIATAIGILAASLLVISTIPTEKLTASLGAIGALMTELMVGFKYFNKLNKVSDNINGLFNTFSDISRFSTKIISFGASILILSLALKTISTIDTNKMAASLATLAGAMAAMVISLRLLGKHVNEIAISSISMIAFAASISILANAMKKISNIGTDNLITSGVAIAGLMAGMVASFILLDKYVWDLPVTAGAMIAFALSISILTSAFKSLSKAQVNFDTFISFAGVIGGLVAGLSILSSYSKELLITSGSMVAFSVAVLLLSKSFKTIGSVDNTSDAILGFASVITSMVASFILLSKIENKLPVTAGAMLAFSAAILVLSAAMKNISKIDNIGTSILGFATTVVGMVGAFAILERYVTKLPVTAGAMLAFSAAILVLSAAMKNISKIDNVAAGLGGFALAVGSLVATFILLSKYALELPVISSSMLVFASSLLILSMAIRTMSGSTGDVIASSLSLLVLTAGLIALAKILPPLTPSLLGFSAAVALLGVGFIALAVSIGMLSSLGSSGLKVLFETIKEGLQMLPDLIMAFKDVMTAILLVVSDRALLIVETILDIVTAIVQGLANKAQALISAGIDLVVNIIAGLSQGLPRLVDSGMKLIISFLDSMSNALNANQDILINAMERFIETVLSVGLKATAGFLKIGINMISKIIEGLLKLSGEISKKVLGIFIEAIGTILGFSPEAIEAGKAFINGLIDGMVSMFSNIITVVKDIANFILDGLKGLLGFNASYSKETFEIGESVDNGIAKGMENNSDVIIDTAENIGETAADTMESAVNNGVDSVMTDLDSAADTIATKVAKMRMEQGKIGFVGSPSAQKIDSLFGEESQGLNNVVIKEATTNLNNLNSSMNNVTTSSTTMSTSLSSSNQSISDAKFRAEQAELAVTYLNTSFSNTSDTVYGLPPILQENSNGLVEIANGAGQATNALYDMSWGGVSPVSQAFQDLSTKISDQIQIFEKFAKNTGVSGQEMLDNMRSQVEGVREWSENLKALGKAGIDEGLLQELAKLGPAGYETVNAFMDLLKEGRLNEANEIYRETLTLSDESTNTILEGFKSLGGDSVEGVTIGIEEKSDEPKKAMELVAKGVEDGYGNQLGIRSPSTVMKRSGEYTIQGLIQGITGPTQSRLMTAIKQLGNKMVQEFNRIAREITQKFASTFSNNVSVMTQAIQKGFEACTTTAQTAATTLISNVKTAMDNAVTTSNFPKVGDNMASGVAQGLSSSAAIKRVCDAAANLVYQAVAAANAAAEINSPSKLFAREIGIPIAEGMAKGITDGTYMPVNAAESLIDSIRNSMLYMNDVLNGNIDFDPVITPRLDLTYLNQGISAINRSFESKNLSGFVDEATDGEVSAGGGVTFNQYNYSRKDLTRLDLYRNTKNLLSSVRGYENIQGAQYG